LPNTLETLGWMKFAVLGTDSDILQLATAARAAGHGISWIGDVRSEDAAAIGHITADGRDRASEWELLLGQGVVDGVLVGRGTASVDQRAEQLKRLAAEAVPILAVHPIFESVLPYYEIDMTRRETGAVIQHFNPIAEHPVFGELADWVREGHPQIGKIHQVTCERRTHGASRDVVLAYLARDIELLATVAGDIRRASAIGPTTPDASFASLQVQMTAVRVSSVRWSVGSTAAAQAGIQLALLGEHGAVTLRETDSSANGQREWQLETAADGTTNMRPLVDVDAASAAIERFVAAVQSQASDRGARSTWETATRDMEVVDAVELSLQKGRTIEVFQQHLTERLAFRGTMAALGCGLLLLAFFAVIVITVIGGAEDKTRPHIASNWALMLFAVLAFFLLLQAVPLLAQRRREPPKEE
jgi:hypothetical protein